MLTVRITDFQRVLGAEVVSNFGSMLSRLVIPWLATLALGVTPFEMGLLLVADVAAGAIGLLLLGAQVDRMGKRSAMVAADMLRATVLGSIAWLAAAQLLSSWMLVLAAAATGLSSVLFELARSAWVAQSVDPSELPTRNAQISGGGSLAETAAFALGGWLYQSVGAVLALLIDATSYLVSALFLRGASAGPVTARSQARETPGTPAPTLIAEAQSGVAALLRSPRLRTLAVIEMLIALAMSLAGTSYMIFVSRELAFETGILGLIFASGGIGSLLGATFAPALGRRVGAGGAMVLGLSLLSIGACCLPMAPAATAAAPEMTLFAVLLLVAHQVIGDGGHTVFAVHDRTLRQTAISPDLLARVDSGIRTLGQSATLVGALGGGALATMFGVRSALTLSGALFTFAAVVTWFRFGRDR